MPGSKPATLASLSRATNKTTSMRAPGLSLLAAVVAISVSDALSTLNGRVDEEHNAIVVEGGYPMHVQSELLSGLQIHARGLEVSLCGRTCVSHKQTQNPKLAQVFIISRDCQDFFIIW